MPVDFSAFSEILWIECFISMKYHRDAEFNPTVLMQVKIPINFMNLHVKMFSVLQSDNLYGNFNANIIYLKLIWQC